MQDEGQASILDTFRVLARHRGRIFLVFACAVIVAACFVLLAPVSYTAQSKILVSIGREKFQHLQMAAEPAGNLIFQQRENDANNEVELLNDPAVIQSALPAVRQRIAVEEAQPLPPPVTTVDAIRDWLKVRKHLLSGWTKHVLTRMKKPLIAIGLVRELTSDQKLALRIASAFHVSHVKETDVIDVSLTWDNPQAAADLLNLVMQQYQKVRMKVFETRHSVSFYDDEVKSSEAELAQIETKLNDFLRQGGISNIEAQKSMLLTQLAQSRQEAERDRTNLENTQVKLQEIERSYHSASPWIETPDATDSIAESQALDQRFVQLFAERNSLLSRMLPSSMQVRNLDAQIAQLRGQKYQSLLSFYRLSASGLQDKLKRINADIEAKQTQLADLTSRTTEYDHLQQRRKLLNGLEEEYRKKVADLSVNDELNANDFSSVRVVSAALPPLRPSFPKPALILGLAAGFGLFAGIASAFVGELLSRTFRSPKDVERILGVPVLACVPDLTG